MDAWGWGCRALRWRPLWCCARTPGWPPTPPPAPTAAYESRAAGAACGGASSIPFAKKGTSGRPIDSAVATARSASFRRRRRGAARGCAPAPCCAGAADDTATASSKYPSALKRRTWMVTPSGCWPWALENGNWREFKRGVAHRPARPTNPHSAVARAVKVRHQRSLS